MNDPANKNVSLSFSVQFYELPSNLLYELALQFVSVFGVTKQLFNFRDN